MLELGSEGKGDSSDYQILPMSTGIDVLPRETTTVTMRTGISLLPERLVVGGISEAWRVETLRIEGREQLRPGGVSGRALSDSFGRFDVVRSCSDVEVRVTYVGDQPDGEAFHAALVGWTADAGSWFIARWSPEGRRASWEVADPSDRAEAPDDRRTSAP